MISAFIIQGYDKGNWVQVSVVFCIYFESLEDLMYSFSVSL